MLDEGLELPKPYGTEFDLDDLLRMDSKTMMDVIARRRSGGDLFAERGPREGESEAHARRRYALPPGAELLTRGARKRDQAPDSPPITVTDATDADSEDDTDPADADEAADETKAFDVARFATAPEPGAQPGGRQCGTDDQIAAAVQTAIELATAPLRHGSPSSRRAPPSRRAMAVTGCQGRQDRSARKAAAGMGRREGRHARGAQGRAGPENPRRVTLCFKDDAGRSRAASSISTIPGFRTSAI